MSAQSGESWAVIGARGEWGRKVVAELRRQIPSGAVHSVTAYDQGDYLGHVDANNIYIATPPATRAGLAASINHRPSTKRWFVEKPALDPGMYEVLGGDVAGVRPEVIFVDHYLQKRAVEKAKHYFQEHQANIAGIEICICESAQETRSWMLSRNEGGGVVHDLAHHAFAILFHLVDWQDTSVRRLAVESVGLFHPGSSEANIKCRFNWNGKEVCFRVSKSSPVDAKHVVFTDGNDEVLYIGALTDTVDYADILLVQQSPARLSLQQETTIAYSLTRLSVEAANCLLSSEESGMAGDTRLRWANHLLDNFRHRHSHFWSSYFRFLLYFVFFISAPFLFMASTNKFNLVEVSQLLDALRLAALFICGITALAGLWVVNFLKREDRRVVAVHDRYKGLMRIAGMEVDVAQENPVSGATSSWKRLIAAMKSKIGPMMCWSFYVLVLSLSAVSVYLLHQIGL